MQLLCKMTFQVIPFEDIHCDPNSSSDAKNDSYHNEVNHSRRKEHCQQLCPCYNDSKNDWQYFLSIS